MPPHSQPPNPMTPCPQSHATPTPPPSPHPHAPPPTPSDAPELPSLKFWFHSLRSVTASLHPPGCPQHLWVSAHPQIVIAAPHGDVLALGHSSVLLGLGESRGQTVDLLEHPVTVVFLLLLNLTMEELPIVKMSQQGSLTCTQVCDK